MLNLRLFKSLLLQLDALHLNVACNLSARHLLGKIESHLLKEPLSGLLAHGGTLLLIAA